MRKQGRAKSIGGAVVSASEAAVLELLRRNPNTQFTCSLVAHKLDSTPAACLMLLKALHERRAIRGGLAIVGMPVFFALHEVSTSTGLTVREDLSPDHTGARQHWVLCMSTRRS